MSHDNSGKEVTGIVKVDDSKASGGLWDIWMLT
jgi:hypothetical protein